MSFPIGVVLKCDWDERPIRVLSFDDVEVLYDSWWPHENAWGLASLKGRATYYRVSTAFLVPRSKQIRVEALSESEMAVHRPDLPLRLCRSSRMQWSKETYPDIQPFSHAVQAVAPEFFSHCSEVVLNIPKIFLCPFGPEGSSKAGVLVNAQNKTHLTGLELLWNAQNLQAPHIHDSKIGTGLYRSGFQRGTPSYYIWGGHDRANNLKDELST